jgi:hypothetical protein
VKNEKRKCMYRYILNEEKKRERKLILETNFPRGKIGERFMELK